MPKIKFTLFLFLSLLCLNLYAQLIQNEKIEINDIKKIHLNLDEVYYLEIITGDFPEMSYVSKSEGEYSDLLQLEINSYGEDVYINSIFDAIVSSGYDKLSSHKVIVFQLKLFVPNTLQVYVKSNIANVMLSGKLPFFKADLKNGNCSLINFLGNAKINTYKGKIEIRTKNAKVEAETRNGELSIQQSSHPNFLMQLKSLDGNISVHQLD